MRCCPTPNVGGRSKLPAIPPALRDPSVRGPELIGRDDELQLLQRRLNSAISRGCQLVVIGGGAGIGKTRLIDEIDALCRAREIRVLRGRYADQESTLPYQGFCELIQDAFRGPQGSRSSHAERPDIQDLARDLRRFFPQLTEIPEIGGSGSSSVVSGRLEVPSDRAGDVLAQRGVVFELLARTLGRLANGQPLVAIVESLHSADISIEALPYIIHRLSPSPVLFIATYRSDEISRGHPMHRMLGGLEGDPGFLHLTLGPLDRSDHRQLVSGLVDDQPVADELAEVLYDSTEGNPLFTQELVRASIDAGGLARDDSGVWILSGDVALSTDALPDTIQQVVLGRIERLPEDRRQLLAVASILGRRFAFEDLDRLATQASVAVDDLEDAVDQLVAEGLLNEDPRRRGDQLQFASSVMRDVLYSGMGRRRRRLLHRRHAAALEARHDGRLKRVYPQLLHHYAEGDVAAKVAEFGQRQARAALEAFLVPEAIRAARMALSFVDDPDGSIDAETEGSLRLLLARAERSGGALASAIRQAEKSVSVFSEADHSGLASEAALLGAETAWQARRVQTAQGLVDRGVALAREAGADKTLRSLLLLGATVANLQGRQGMARAQLDEAASLDSVETADEEIMEGGTLVTVLPNPITNLEPGQHEVVEDAEVLATVFETLIGSDEDGYPVPDLCASWSVSDDGQAFRFTLRPEVRFADGSPLTAEVVKQSLERTAQRRTGTMEVTAFGALAGVDDFRRGLQSEITGIEVEDEQTVLFRLEEPLPIFPILLSDPGSAIARRLAEGSFVGTGPFRLLEQDSRGATVERNDAYWRGNRPRLKRVRFRTDLDAAGIADGLRAGEIDVGRDLQPGALTEIQGDPRFRGNLVEQVKRNVYFLLFNARGPASRHAETRRALARALRVQDLVWRNLGRFAQPAVGLIPPGILGHDPGRRRQTLSRDEARRLLAGVEGGLPLQLRAGVHPQWLDRYRALTEAILGEWQALGVEVEIVTPDLESYLPLARKNDDIDLLFGRWFADYADPDNFTYGLLHGEHGHYRLYWNSPEANALFERARHERRADVRVRLYRQIERTIAESHILLPMFHDIDYRLCGPRVRNLAMISREPFVNYAAIGLLRQDDKGDSAVRSFPERGTLRVPLGSRVENIDPLSTLDADTAEIVPAVFETLLRVEDGARIVPGLAERFEVRGQGRALHLQLRRGVRFHDGRRLTVRDVRYTFERLLRHGDPALLGPMMAIRGAAVFRAGEAPEIEGLRLISATEIHFELERPVAFFANTLAAAFTGIVADGSSVFHGNWRRGCTGTGPFRLVSLEADERVELEAHPGYWRRGLPRCERMIFELRSPPARTVDEFERGRLALALDLRPEDVEQLRGSVELARGYAETPGLGTYYLLFNTRDDSPIDRELRQTLADLLETEALVRAHVGRLGNPAHGLIPPGLLGHESAPRPSATSRADRSRLIDLPLRVAVDPVYPRRYRALWESVLAVWKDAGVQVEVVKAGADGDAPADVRATRWLADYPDPDSFASLFHSRHGLDGSFCPDPEIDQFIHAGRHEVEPALRHVAYRDLEHALARRVQIVPLFYEQTVRFARPEVIGMRAGLRLPEIAYEELRRIL